MNPEIDKIASAALDGEATPEELARLGDDPTFVAAKAELGAVSAFLSQTELPSAPDGLAQTQISLAMGQFRADAAQNALLAAQPSQSTASTATSRPAPSKWAMPSWLLPALFSVAVLGGLGIAASNLSTGGSDDAAAESADSALRAATTEAMEDEGAMEEAMEDEETSLFDDAAEDLDFTETTLAAATTTQPGSAPLVAPDPIDLEGATFNALKTVTPDEVARRATRTPPLDPDLYDRCGPEHGYAPPLEAQKLVSVVPFTRDSEPAEVLVYETADAEGQITVILSESCKVLDQS